MMSFVESVSNLRRDVYVGKNAIYVETYLLDQEGRFSAKVEKNGQIYYLNNLTGEEELFGDKNVAFRNLKTPTRFKLKNKHLDPSEGLEIYRAENKDMLIEHHVDPQVELTVDGDLCRELLYDNKLIVRSTRVVKNKGMEIINELVSIDTLDSEMEVWDEGVNGHDELLLLNNNRLDSISYNEELPDLYVKVIGSKSALSLNKFKGNGKYLMVDFWGTWCKPCIASIPELKSFYQEFSAQIDLLSLNYGDSNETRVHKKIQELGMQWEQGIVPEKLLAILNPEVYFPGILLFDDEMRLLVRDRSKSALIKVRSILEN